MTTYTENNISVVEITKYGVDKCEVYYQMYPDPSSNPYIFIPFAIFYMVIFTLGIIGNVSIIYVTVRHKVLQSVQNMFILNLAASDIIVCLLSLPITPVTNVFKNWYFGEVLCRLIALIQGVSIYICTFSLGAIAVDRYILVVKPHSKALSRKGALVVTGILWTLSLIFNIPYVLFMYIQSYEGVCGVFCTEKWPNPESRRAYTLMVMVAQFVFPFSVMAFCYATIFSKLKSRAKLRIRKIDERFVALGRSSNYTNISEHLAMETDNKTCVVLSTTLTVTNNIEISKGNVPTLALQKEKDKQRLLNQTRRNTIILVSMVVIFGLTWLPHNVVSLVLEYDEDQTIFKIDGDDDLDLSYLVNLFTHSIAMTNIVFNPVLYAWLNPQFRDLCIQTFYKNRKAKSTNKNLSKCITSETKLNHNDSFIPLRDEGKKIITSYQTSKTMEQQQNNLSNVVSNNTKKLIKKINNDSVETMKMLSSNSSFIDCETIEGQFNSIEQSSCEDVIV
ncbi:Prolactin-releasing peptide receptor [Strongyloides ratti]|uniref:Prolactin-releasing peptide receptor n=1 Tax=Strongyloides ratti TaxID=34506 RepID=A0A090LT72_STRRB|nr:Prolactin-releasing peptide receptor [Strongyloides ratti]CEF71417.1 Prolactin-releasing peptide receptor [Strongyloides ratti]